MSVHPENRSPLNRGKLLELFAGRALALHIREFVSPHSAIEIAHRLVPRVDYGFIRNVPNLGCIGLAYKTAAYDDWLKEIYYASAANWESRLREASAPHESPLATMIAAFTAMWQAGVQRERVDGRPMFAGAVRVLINGSGSPPHQDLLARDAGPDNPRVQVMRGHFAATLYLVASRTGGELLLWNKQVVNCRTVTRGNRAIDAMDPTHLGPPDLTIGPSAGDLVIYDNRLIHATRPDPEGLQVTISMIIGYYGDDDPLSVWS